MAGYPPPYPNQGTPYGFDPRQQRDAVRAQIKAQRAAFRAQRDLYRYQSRALRTSQRRSSILGPLVVVAAGVIILLIRWGKLPFDRFASWYASWWPMLLVAAGVILVLEWVFDQRMQTAGAPYVRRGIGGGAIFLILLIAAGGAAMNGFRDGRDVLMHGFSINPDNIDEFFGDKHEMTQALDHDFAPGTLLMLDNPHGDVTITGHSNDGKVHILVNKQVWTHSDQAADGKADQLNPQVAQDGSALTFTVPSVQGGVADLSVTMPDTGAVSVNANHGTVNVSDMKAPVTVTANHGDVQLNSVAGAVNAHINHGDSSFSAHNITGDVSVRGHAQDLNVTEVKGGVSLEGEFFGETHLEHVQGPVDFRTARTQFSLARLTGQVDISPNSELTGSQIVGPTRLKTSSRNIDFTRMVGDVDVSNSRGTVDVASAAPLGNVTIQNRDGAVTLTVPEHAGLSIDAETKGGSIENSLGLSATSENDRSVLRGSVGDAAAKVMIRTNHFDIDVHRGSVEAPAAPSTDDATPKPPAPPEKPSHPAKAVKPVTET